MAVSRVDNVDKQFRDHLQALRTRYQAQSWQPEDTPFDGSSMTVSEACQLLESQVTSRWVDFVARELKAEGKSFYTIGSSGHEGNAMVAMATRHTDPAFLHYRSGGFFFARAAQVPGSTPIFDTALSLTASSEDPISGGRHKVWGSVPLNIPPQTSTIASHLPKAMGMAFFLGRREKLPAREDLPNDSIVVCSFGDASANHATALSGINASAWCAYQNLPMPLLYVCEDNGIGISVRTPAEWIRSNYRNRAGMTYIEADGLDMVTGWDRVKQAVQTCRERRRPVFLHLRTVRLLGHAGSDVEITYHSREQIEAAEARDPLLRTAGHLVRAGILSPDEITTRYDRIAEQVRAAGREASNRPKHTTAATVMTPLFPDYSQTDLSPLDISREERDRFWNGRLPEDQKPRHMAQLINWGLQDLMLTHGDIVLFGEDVAKKGGVYHVSAELYQKFRVGRVFNTLLDETSILGLAIGAGHCNLMPIPEIQYLAYLHNAIDQLRGEACSLQYFSEGRFRNPMVVRIAGFAYQRGFGGHFHNDNAFAALRDIPGIIMVTAASGPDAVRLMRTCVRLAKQHGAVVAFIEPIALYMQKQLTDEQGWTFDYPPPGDLMPMGEVGRHGDPSADVLVISYANGTYLSLQAMADLKAKGIAVDLLDLRFLTPLNHEALVDAARGKSAVVIVDECRQTASLSEEITWRLVEGLQASKLPHISRVVGDDTYIPLGHAWEYVLPSRESIARAIEEAVNHG